MLTIHDLDERGVATPGVPIAMLQPEGFAQPKPGLRQQHPQQPVADRPAPLPSLGVPARAGLANQLDLLRRQDRWCRSAPVADPDHRPPAALPAGDVLQQRLVATAAPIGDPVQVPAHVDPVEDVVVVAGDHRPQPRRDRRLGKPRRTTLDRRDHRLITGAQPGQERPEVLHRHRVPAQPERIQELPPQRQRPRVGLDRVRRRPLRPQVLQVSLGRLDQVMVPAHHRPRPLTRGKGQPLRPVRGPRCGCHAPHHRNHR